MLIALAFLAGLVTSFVLGHLRRGVERKQHAKRGHSDRHIAQSNRRITKVGNLEFSWVVGAYGPFKEENIESHYHADEPIYPLEVESALAEFTAEMAAKQAKGEDVPWDGEDYKLVRFHVSSREGESEEPRLVLHFAPTTYYRMLVTDQRLDVPMTVAGTTATLRERYAANVDLRCEVVPELATSWGAGLSVVTNDGYLLFAERGKTAVGADTFGPSVAEGASRAADSGADGAPDQFGIAKRGIEEELGVPLLPEELTWLSFGANSSLCEFGLIGLVRTPFTFAEIVDRRSLGAAKDSWETKELYAVKFCLDDVANFLSQDDKLFSPFGLIAVVHALVHKFGIADVEVAFAKIEVNVTQQLPE